MTFVSLGGVKATKTGRIECSLSVSKAHIPDLTKMDVLDPGGVGNWVGGMLVAAGAIAPARIGG